MARRKKMSSLQTGFRSNKISELLGNPKRRSFTSAEISALALGQDLTAANKFRKVSKRTGLAAGEVSEYYSSGGETPDFFISSDGDGVGTEEDPFGPAEFETALGDGTITSGDIIAFQRGDTFNED